MKRKVFSLSPAFWVPASGFCGFYKFVVVLKMSLMCVCVCGGGGGGWRLKL